MPGDFAPAGSNPRMTKAQIRRYNKERDEAKKIAQEKLDEALANGEFDETEELNKLEDKLDDVF